MTDKRKPSSIDTLLIGYRRMVTGGVVPRVTIERNVDTTCVEVFIGDTVVVREYGDTAEEAAEAALETLRGQGAGC